MPGIASTAPGGNAKKHVTELLNFQRGRRSKNPLEPFYFIVQCILGYARETMALKFRPIVGIGKI
jgi:hypothetical protein